MTCGISWHLSLSLLSHSTDTAQQQLLSLCISNIASRSGGGAARYFFACLTSLDGAWLRDQPIRASFEQADSSCLWNRHLQDRCHRSEACIVGANNGQGPTRQPEATGGPSVVSLNPEP